MYSLYVMLTVPVVAVGLLALYGHRGRWAGSMNVLLCAGSLAAAILMAITVMRRGAWTSANGFWHVDAFNVYLLVLTCFVSLTTALFSRPYMAHEQAIGRVTPGRMRLYHASFQGFLFTMLLALSTNNLGVLWVAMEGATLSSVLLVSLYRTPEAIEAAWKYFILCGVGIAQALFGTILMYFAASSIEGSEQALSWSHLYAHADQLKPAAISIAFAFLLVGYGTKVGLVPLHNWLPDAHSEGPTPMSAVLSGLLLNVALYALVRLKMLTDGALADGEHAAIAGQLMMGFGLLSFMVAGLFLHRQQDIKRLFSYSSIEHMGLMTFGFGLGGPLATFGALLHMTVHSLTKSAIFVTVGHASQIAGTQRLDKIRGLLDIHPGVGWGLLIGTAAIAGFPPFGIFTSEFLLLTATMHHAPWLTLPLLMGLVVAFAGLFRAIQPVVYSAPPERFHPVKASMWPVTIHYALVLWLGLAIPAVLARWFDQATRLITGGHVL